MLLADTEQLALRLVAALGLGAVLAALANTPIYPLVLGSEVLALIYVVSSTKADPTKALNWIGGNL